MTNALQVFNYEGNQIRTIEHDSKAWFIAKDVCDILGIKNVPDAIKSLDDDEKMTIANTDSHSGQRGGAQFMNIISEAGVYKLIFKSRKPEAIKFNRWLAHEVLPSIRKTGAYIPDEAFKNPEFVKKLAERIAFLQETNEILSSQVDTYRAKAVIADIFVNLEDTNLTVQQTAQLMKQYGFDIGMNRLYALLRDFFKYLCRRKGEQYNKPTQKAIEQGILRLVLEPVLPLSKKKCRVKTRVTIKGVTKIVNILTKELFPIEYEIDRAEARAKKALA